MLVDADLAFLIDPIDGTRNYVAGLPLFGMMIAACHRGDVIAGVIYDPVNRDSALAVRGEGAWMEYENGKQAALAVAAPAPPEDMDGLISTGALPEPLRTTVNGNLSRLQHRQPALRCARIPHAGRRPQPRGAVQPADRVGPRRRLAAAPRSGRLRGAL